GLGADREILRDRVQRRLRLTGAHAARPRHPRRLRPTQERNREAICPRAAGTARHGDDGLIPMAFGRFLMRLLLVPLGGCIAVCVAMLFVMVAQWNRVATLNHDDISGLTIFFVVVPMLAVTSGVMLLPGIVTALIA